MIQSCLGFSLLWLFLFNDPIQNGPLVAMSLRLLLAVVLPLTCVVSDDAGQAFCRMSLLACLMFFLWLDMDYGNKTTKIKPYVYHIGERAHTINMICYCWQCSCIGLRKGCQTSSFELSFTRFYILYLWEKVLWNPKRKLTLASYSLIYTHIYTTHTHRDKCAYTHTQHTHTQWQMCTTHTHTHIWTNK